MTPAVEGAMRQAGDAARRVEKAQSGYRKEGVTRQAGDRKEWARRLK